MTRRLSIATVSLCALAVSGCASVSESYLDADRATYRAIAPQYRQYVEQDSSLDTESRQRALNTLDSWELRLRIHKP